MNKPLRLVIYGPNFKILPDEIIVQIIINLDNKSLCSFLSINRKMSIFNGNYKDKIFLYGIERELKYADVRTKKYFKNEIYDFKVGDRIEADSYTMLNPKLSCTAYGNSRKDTKNYKIIEIKGKNGKMIHVDAPGNILDNKLIDIRIKKGKWITTIDEETIYPGILLFDNGPHIDNINSKYLIYKLSNNNIPELNIIVQIKVGEDKIANTTYTLEYAITEISLNYMKLEYIGYFRHLENYGKVEFILNVENINNAWIITNNEDYKIHRFGDFGEYRQENIPF